MYIFFRLFYKCAFFVLKLFSLWMQFINWSQWYLHWICCTRLLQDLWNPFHFRFKVRKMYILETSGGYHCLPCRCYATVQAVVDCFLAIGGLFAGFILYSELESLCVCGAGVVVYVSPYCSCMIWISNISFRLLKYTQFYIRLAFLLVKAEKNSGPFVQGNLQNSKH